MKADATTMRVSIACLVLCVLKLTVASIIDVFEKTNGHEPRVAIQCGRVPFHIDLQVIVLYILYYLIIFNISF